MNVEFELIEFARSVSGPDLWNYKAAMSSPYADQ